MRYLLFAILVLMLSCNSSNEKQALDDTKIIYEMYEPSEMAILMNDMYAYNLELKKKIIDGDIPKEFPLDFLKIHTAELSDFKARNEVFKVILKVFIEAERNVFIPDTLITIEERFNYAVGVCIACHQTECTGPIPKIKKLLIR